MSVSATLSGVYSMNPACGATIAELVPSMQDGNADVNVHSPALPGGEVREQISQN